MSRAPAALLLLAALLLPAAHASAQTWPAAPDAAPTTAPTTAPGRAGFGAALLVDGETILAARTGESALFPAPASQEGALYVFRRGADGAWTEAQALTPDDVALGDGFGAAMALEGDWLAVSAPKAEDGCGAVYLFERTGGAWLQADRVAAAGCGAGRAADGLGTSLAFFDGRLLAGAPAQDAGRGAVYVFDATEEGWVETLRLTSSASTTHEAFGAALARYRTGLLVGAPGHAEGRGLVYRFRADARGFLPEASLAPEGDVRFFGQALAAEDGRLLVAAPGMQMQNNPFGARPQPGAVFAYAWDDTDAENHWRPVGRLTTTDEQNASIGYGLDVALDGGGAWVGAPFAQGMRGAVDVYRAQGDRWRKAQTLTERTLPAGAGFGTRLAVGGDVAAVGALRADFGEGRGFVFTREGDTWEPAGTVADQGRALSALTGEKRPCADGAVGEFACDQVDLLSFLPVDAVGGERGVIVNDVWGWTDQATGREYALVGRSNGTSFIDVTDPTAPVYLGNLPATEGSVPNAWRDVKTYADHALIVADNVGEHGMQVFDLTKLRDVPDAPATFEADAVYDEIASAHNVIVNEDTGFAYIVAASGGGRTCGGGLHIVDMRDPKAPAFAGCFHDQSSPLSGRGYTHDAQCVDYRGPDADYQGREICFGSNESALNIADVTDKDAPVSIVTIAYPNVAYAHQGWLTEDQRYFYMNDEGDELSTEMEGTRTLIWDVSDLDDPVLAKEFFGTTRASDHNLYVRGDQMYQSNYVAGLRILDVSDPVNPKEIGYFDTVPWSENVPGFAGSWSNYPYFDSGTIVVTSVNEGVFLLQKKELLP